MKKIKIYTALFVIATILSVNNINTLLEFDTSTIKSAIAEVPSGGGFDTTGESQSLPCSKGFDIFVEQHKWEETDFLGFHVGFHFTPTMVVPEVSNYWNRISYVAEVSQTVRATGYGNEYLCPGDDEDCRVIPCDAEAPPVSEININWN